MIPKEKQAAQMMLGLKLKEGWIVVKRFEKDIYTTGGVYSSCYEVENNGRKGFLKAFDLSGAEKVGVESSNQISNILNAYRFEREILERCVKKNNVIQLIGFGDLEVDGAQKYPRVDYLILEYATNGDVRKAMHDKKATMEWKIKSLHQLAKGLSQIHAIQIAHQDIKPSNVVTLENNITKITDFGSAIPLNAGNVVLPNHLERDYAGTWEYAPPELLYGFKSLDPLVRRIGCDLYLLGSMVAFYFTDMSMTALISSNLADTLSWKNQSTYGKYEQIKPYIILAFEQALEDIERAIQDDKIKVQIIKIIRYLCHPDPALRGHDRTINEAGHNYSLHRFITMFDQLYRYFKFK